MNKLRFFLYTIVLCSTLPVLGYGQSIQETIDFLNTKFEIESLGKTYLGKPIPFKYIISIKDSELVLIKKDSKNRTNEQRVLPTDLSPTPVNEVRLPIGNEKQLPVAINLNDIKLPMSEIKASDFFIVFPCRDYKRCVRGMSVYPYYQIFIAIQNKELNLKVKKAMQHLLKKMGAKEDLF